MTPPAERHLEASKKKADGRYLMGNAIFKIDPKAILHYIETIAKNRDTVIGKTKNSLTKYRYVFLKGVEVER